MGRGCREKGATGESDVGKGKFGNAEKWKMAGVEKETGEDRGCDGDWRNLSWRGKGGGDRGRGRGVDARDRVAALVMRRDHEVFNFTRSRVKNNSKFTNLMI